MADKNKSNLQAKVDRWLTRLNNIQKIASAVATGINFSPLKKDKHNTTQPVVPLTAPRVLLYLLTEKVLNAVWGQAEPEQLAILTGYWLDSEESQLAATLRPEINRENSPDAWELATLQLTPLLSSQKRQGAFYTPPDLARKITAQTLSGQVAGTIVDPACGGGVFLLAALELLVQQYSASDPVSLLIKHIYGLDLNPVACGLARLTLLQGLYQLEAKPPAPEIVYNLARQIRVGNALVGNISQAIPAELASPTWNKALTKADYENFEALAASAREQLGAEIAGLPIFNHPQDGQKLVGLSPFSWQLEFPEVFAEGGFSAVLGNPPYVGFNDYSGLEKAYFAYNYAPVYNLKSDLLYYFIKRGIDLLKPNGRLGFVTSRFWKEAVYAAPLRQWLVTQHRVMAIEDLDRTQFFEDAEVDVCLLYVCRQSPGTQFPFSYAGKTELIEQKNLGSAPWAWLRKLPAERLLLEKINEQSQPLGKIALCRTGVQSGRDEVFFLDTRQALELGLEEANLRPAIKNGDITAGKIGWRGLRLIYTGPDFSQEKYPVLWSYLVKKRQLLEQRQRYDKSFPFYQLQWPREPAVFEIPLKLVTPYKAPRNTFALDNQQFYFSTDVISLVFPPKWTKAGFIFAQNFLNSQLSTFQFRSYGKLMSGGQWDYYANPVKKLAFPLINRPEQHQLAEPTLNPAEIDELVYQLFNLNPAEKNLIKI